MFWAIGSKRHSGFRAKFWAFFVDLAQVRQNIHPDLIIHVHEVRQHPIFTDHPFFQPPEIRLRISIFLPDGAMPNHLPQVMD